MIITTNAVSNYNIKNSFDHILPITLSKIFKKYKIFPAISKTNENNVWNQAGLTRTVFFEDGNIAKEELLLVESPYYFSYRVSDFSSMLRFFIDSIDGNWKFVEQNNQTLITWEYKLNPKNKLSEWILDTFLKKDMKNYLQKSINLAIQDLSTNYKTKYIQTNLIHL